MENLKELTKDECKSINGRNIMSDFWYGVGYAAGSIANGIDAAVEWMTEQQWGSYYY